MTSVLDVAMATHEFGGGCESYSIFGDSRIVVVRTAQPACYS